MKGIKLIVDNHKQNYENLVIIAKNLAKLKIGFNYLNQYCDLLNQYQNEILGNHLPEIKDGILNNKITIIENRTRISKLEHTIKYLYIVIGLLFATIILVLVILITLL